MKNISSPRFSIEDNKQENKNFFGSISLTINLTPSPQQNGKKKTPEQKRNAMKFTFVNKTPEQKRNSIRLFTPVNKTPGQPLWNTYCKEVVEKNDNNFPHRGNSESSSFPERKGNSMEFTPTNKNKKFPALS
jgi:hypothetical protein